MSDPKASATEPGKPPRKVLIVEDSALTRLGCKRLLEDSGFQVLQAKDGAEAIAVAREGKPDLAILDVNLPYLDGYEVCRRLRTDPGLSRLPVIFCTSNDKREEVLEAKRAGASDYLVKPFRPSVLLEKVRKHLPGTAGAP